MFVNNELSWFILMFMFGSNPKTFYSKPNINNLIDPFRKSLSKH